MQSKHTVDTNALYGKWPIWTMQCFVGPHTTFRFRSVDGSLQNVQGHRVNKVIPDHARTLILTLNLTLTLSLNPKALILSITLNPITNPIWCDPVNPVILYVLQWLPSSIVLFTGRIWIWWILVSPSWGGIRTFCSPVFLLLGTKISSGNLHSQERKFPGTFVPGSQLAFWPQ